MHSCHLLQQKPFVSTINILFFAPFFCAFLLTTFATIMSTAAALQQQQMLPFYRRLPLQIKKLSENAVIPVQGSKHAAGLDLSSAVNMTIKAGDRALVKTDLSIACPEGTYGRIAPRSGLAYKKGIDVGAGVIDADYRGPLGVILFNFGKEDFEVKQGDRIAQLILEQIVLPDIQEVENLDETVRGEGGFGSTGVEAKKQRTISPNAVDAPGEKLEEN